MIRLENVLVATDFSEPSNAAAEYDRELARTFGSTLTAMQPQVTHPHRRRRLDRQMPVALTLVFLSAWLSSVPSEAADFSCAGGDVACLVAAINQANANGQENTISLAAGVYTLTAVDNQTDGANGLPSVSSTLTIQGAGADLTSIERDPGAPLFRIVHVASGGVLTLHRVTVRKGTLEDSVRDARGGGVLAQGAVIISESVVTENGSQLSRGLTGGGVAGGQVVITHSTISANVAGVFGTAGGVYIGPDGTLTVTNSLISGNGGSQGRGGILFASHGPLVLTDSMVVGNVVFTPVGVGNGGGVYIGSVGGGGNTTTITNSTIADNTAHEGGGIYYAFPEGAIEITHSAIIGNVGIDHGGGVAFVGTLTIADSTIANNLAPFGSGGGIFAHDFGGVVGGGPGSGTVTNSTIVQNSAGLSFGGGGGGVVAEGVAGAIRLQNTIVANNTGTMGPSGPPFPSDCQGSIMSLGHNVFGDPTGCGALLPSDLTGDPGLGDFIDPGLPGTGHFPLLAGSHAIDAGDNAACGATDQLGQSRPVDGDGDGVRTCDIGAIEFAPVTITSLTATPRVLWPPNHKMVSVSVAASASEGGAVAPVCQITAVSSDEGFTTPGQVDWAITGPLTVNLRAERAGSGHGRVYTITVTCTNAARGSATQNVTVTVAHDQGK